MGKHIFQILLILPFIIACGQRGHETTYTVVIENLSTLPNDSLGVSAPIGGVLGDYIIVAGGCNFPDVSAADGGSKAYYKNIWAIHKDSLKDGNWQKIGELPFTLAYAVSISTDKGLFYAGGLNGEQKKSNSAFFINYHKNKLTITPVSPLPFSIDNAGCCMIDNNIYVFGGNQEGQTNTKLLSYNMLSDQWTVIDSLENESRIQPVVVAVNSGKQKAIFATGGFSTSNDKAQVFTDSRIYDLSLKKWNKIDSPQVDTCAISFSGGVGTSLNDSLLIFMGGVNKEVFTYGLTNSLLLSEAKEKQQTQEIEKLESKVFEYMTQPQSYYRFNKEIWLYNFNSKKWTMINTSEQTALAGAHLISTESGILIFNGEIKPGIRTPKIKLIKIQ